MYMAVGLTSSGRGAWRRAVACGGREEDAGLRWVKKPAPLWTVLQLLQTCLPSGFDCYVIVILKVLMLAWNIVLSPRNSKRIFRRVFNMYSPLLHHLRSSYIELVELQLENHLKLVKMPATNFILKSSSMSDLIDSKNESAINRVFQQIGFLGVQMSDKGKLYSSTLVGEMTYLFYRKYLFSSTYRTEEFSFMRSCLFYGLDPYQEMVHSISSREVMVRSSGGLAKLGTLFKNLISTKDRINYLQQSFHLVNNVCNN
ncbi:hypothetical protein LguiA_025720 [Lonicera macranthoides]